MLSLYVIFWKRMTLLWITLSCIKVLLQPSYHSTDLLVHRHWKALTRDVMSTTEWYFDNEFVVNRHSLDYPPAFAWWEAWWSNVLPPSRLQWIVEPLLVPAAGQSTHADDWTDQCLQLLPSDDNDHVDKDSLDGTAAAAVVMTDKDMIQSNPACKAYLRTTVWWSDVVLWWGAWQLTTSAVCQQTLRWTVFISVVAHPAFLWLDHVHFQYNGLLLGIWMLSLACLVRAAALPSSSSSAAAASLRAYHFHYLTAAILFALLLTLKHLYLPLSLWYLVYLFRAYCWKPSTSNNQTIFINNIYWHRLFLLGAVTLTTLCIPFVPYLWSRQALHSQTERWTRLLERLFPFGRGLVHDYWAGNVWALYVATDKVLRFVTGTLSSLPVVTPAVAAVVLVVAVVPGAVGAWYAAAAAVTSSTEPRASTMPRLFWSSLTYTTLACFATAYHGHEKAIVTSLIPLTMGFWTGGNRHLVWRTHAVALLSLLPLLFPATETCMKVISMMSYLAWLYHVLLDKDDDQTSSKKEKDDSSWHWPDIFLTRTTMIVIALTVVLLEGVPLSMWGRYSFAPLALTSLVSAMGLSVLAWGQVSWDLWRQLSPSCE